MLAGCPSARWRCPGSPPQWPPRAGGGARTVLSTSVRPPSSCPISTMPPSDPWSVEGTGGSLPARPQHLIHQVVYLVHGSQQLEGLGNHLTKLTFHGLHLGLWRWSGWRSQQGQLRVRLMQRQITNGARCWSWDAAGAHFLDAAARRRRKKEIGTDMLRRLDGLGGCGTCTRTVCSSVELASMPQVGIFSPTRRPQAWRGGQPTVS